VDVLWARAKIEALYDQALAGMDATQLRQQVIDVALRHHLVSKYTSLLAVDVTPSRPDTDPLLTQTVPVNLPAGMVYSKVFGALPQTATPAPLLVLAGGLLLLCGMTLRLRLRAA
jgi:Ca-activated chloride channel family protein